MNEFKFKSFELRLKESEKVLNKHINSVPIIVDTNTDDVQKLDKNKYIVPNHMKVAEFIVILRKRLTLRPAQAIFLLVNNTLVTPTLTIKDIYDKHKETDGFLYIIYKFENTFGY